MKRKAFSLVELSIVLVILGLLTGGILAGKSLIRASELRSVSTDLVRYQTASYAFRDKYMSWPGDMTNATSFWGAVNADATTCRTAVGTGTQTCNGDGDGYIGNYVSSTHYERFRAWQHLANAGLIEGSFLGRTFTGAEDPGDYVGTPQAVPASRISGAVFQWAARPEPGTGPSLYEFDFIPWGTTLHFGKPKATTTGLPDDPVLTPGETWNIDTKMDDGRASRGKVWATPRGSCTTAADSSDTTAEYALNITTAQCFLVFRVR